jgi:hypothetical protein
LRHLRYVERDGEDAVHVLIIPDRCDAE